ncbi:GAF domain-containing protein [Salinisphaera sp. Q1T1-3]|uniref:GAF domain-containing protein n=1 Tax=Salinisphaera sp. Q1T1-3 TaxID=2321229 RepID=UPI000E73020A|nr:GAF domain-containing protein [Salinisphaera sp. Q1T1-3]RJS91980.1 GAF domain-containing protein [Salinisphaera sp. Q1T1-3]
MSPTTPDLLTRQLQALLDTDDWLTNAAQMVAFIKAEMPGLNWVGFYLQRRPDVLVLGPFQGLPACNPIPFSKGVCGAAASTRTTQRIDDVHAFPGHIVCDAASRSELVVPVVHDDRVWGVLDIDSPEPARFDAADQARIEAMVAVFVAASAGTLSGAVSMVRS